MTSTMPPAAGPSAERLDEMMRVDHAGEFGAVQIYRGQLAVLRQAKGHEDTVALIEEMAEGEEEHLAAFNTLLNERQIRPTALLPFWEAAGFGLGAVTALMGKKAAMACTSAVESVIEQHYQDQVDELGEHEPDFSAMVAKFREEELEHHDTAIEEGAEDTPGYALLKGAIGLGCRVAIKVAEKV